MEVGIGGALGLGAGRAARWIAAALGRLPHSQGGGLPVLVMGEAVARALDRAAITILLLEQGTRPRRRGRGLPALLADPAELPLQEGAAAGAVIARLDHSSLGATLGECARVVRDGGLVAVTSPTGGLLRRPPAPEVVAGALLHARLVDIEQRLVGATVVTLGWVRRAAR